MLQEGSAAKEPPPPRWIWGPHTAAGGTGWGFSLAQPRVKGHSSRRGTTGSISALTSHPQQWGAAPQYEHPYGAGGLQGDCSPT